VIPEELLQLGSWPRDLGGHLVLVPLLPPLVLAPRRRPRELAVELGRQFQQHGASPIATVQVLQQGNGCHLLHSGRDAAGVLLRAFLALEHDVAVPPVVAAHEVDISVGLLGLLRVLALPGAEQQGQALLSTHGRGHVWQAVGNLKEAGQGQLAHGPERQRVPWSATTVERPLSRLETVAVHDGAHHERVRREVVEKLLQHRRRAEHLQ